MGADTKGQAMSVKRTCYAALLLIAVCLSTDARQALAEITAPAVPSAKEDFDSRETIGGFVEVPGRGLMRYYAQNDPLYGDIMYEGYQSPTIRPMKNAACVPTAFAIALANLVPRDELNRLAEFSYKGSGYSFCACCIWPKKCYRRHPQYDLSTNEEYERYLPLVVAGYAVGNNPKREVFRQKTGTSSRFFDALCEIYEIPYQHRQSYIDTEAAFAHGAIAVACTATKYSPFSATGIGHYIVFIWADEEYLYFLDPVYTDNYRRTDTNRILEVLTPGVLRVRKENRRELCVTSLFLMFPPAYAAMQDGING